MARTSTASFTAAVIGANFYPFIRASFPIVSGGNQFLPNWHVEAMAYQLWLLRRCPVGSDQEDWFRAEAELKDKHQGNQQAA